ncbi:zinc finger and BTB domain-containing protein 25 isoform X2 [Protopterus annectens]|nr:zinc finger and BTB domain-containing protein 25 isoform X2 [Protopterus annectens]
MSSSLQPTETEEEPPCKRKEVSVFRQEIQQVLHSFPALEMESSFRDHFPQYDSPAIHCHYKCNQRNCEAVTLDSKKGDQFAHKWLSDRSVACCKRTGVYWLVFEEGQGMYCFLCRKHNTYNKQNKVKVFNTTPAVRFKKSAIQDHAQSQQHMLSILAELASRESNTVMMAKEKEEISLLSSAFRTAYWLAKEEIPCAKLVSLLNFLKDPCLQERKYFETVDSVQNIYSCLGIAIQNQLMQTIQQAGCYGLLFGKLINTELEDLLLAFIQYVEPITAEVKTKFLFAKYVGRNADQSEADVIVELIKSSIKDLGLSSHKMTSAVTDGADVMTHKALGVTAQFKEIVPTLIAFHSLFPKLSFIAGADKSSQDRYMEDIEECMAEIWKLFSTSSRLVTLYLEELLEMKGLGFTSKKVKEFVHRKLLQTCRARQCLLVASAEGICNDYSILLKILSDFQNSSRNASNLLRKLQSVMFIGSVYILREVYPILLTLTNIFQKGKVNFTTMESSVNYSVHQLNEVVNSKRPLVKLKNDLMPNGCLSYTKMTLDTQQEGELNRLLEAHVSAIKRNISSRLDSCLPLLSAFSIFNPLLVPSIDSPNFFEYGHQEIMVLSNHFYRRDEKKDAKIKELKDEWEHFKLDLCNWKNIVPADVLTGCAMTVTEWSLKCLFTMKRESGHPYPNLLPFAEICLSIPFTSMWPKEGLTALRRLEKDCEGHINSGLLNSWLHIVINGPEFGVPDCSSIVYGGIKTFMNQRQPQLSSPFKMKSLGRAVDSQASDDDTVERCQEFKDIQSEVCEVINALGISAGLEDLSNVPA